MTIYLGVNCPVCDKKFTADDDIVVCPTCGAPHHRECYAKEGRCVFEDEHITGKAWSAPKKDLGVPPNNSSSSDYCINPSDGKAWDGMAEETKLCPVCSAKNPKDNIFCCNCGNRLSSPEATTNPFSFPQQNAYSTDANAQKFIFGDVSPTEKIAGHEVRDIATFIGPNSAYYLNQFKAQDKGEKRFTFTLSAFFFSFAYFFYRKMYKIGAIFLAIYILLTIPSLFLAKETLPLAMRETFTSEQLEDMGIDPEALTADVDMDKLDRYNNFNTIIFIVRTTVMFASGFLAIRLYFNHTKKKLDEIQESTSSSSLSSLSKNQRLKIEGGVNTRLVAITLAVLLLISTAYGVYLGYKITTNVSYATSSSEITTASQISATSFETLATDADFAENYSIFFSKPLIKGD